jgi:hypothetical protein
LNEIKHKAHEGYLNLTFTNDDKIAQGHRKLHLFMPTSHRKHDRKPRAKGSQFSGKIA